jgi:hypothetical protein
MNSTSLIAIEMVLVLGGALGWGLWELWSLRRDKRPKDVRDTRAADGKTDSKPR